MPAIIKLLYKLKHRCTVCVLFYYLPVLIICMATDSYAA
jgi:hypothetical protein